MPPAVLEAMEWPLGRAFKVYPLADGGFEVVHVATGLWMQTTRSMGLGDAAGMLLRAAERQKQ